MPVIGRLDEQVNDVLIDPIGKRRAGEESEPAHAPSNDSRRDANDDEDASGDSTRRSDDGKKSARVEDDKVRARDDERLPVWLL